MKDKRVKTSIAKDKVYTGDGLWMYALSAGKADAVLVGSGKTACLVDAGYVRSRGKILTALRQLGVDRLSAVFVTHTDLDHTEGLRWLAKSGIKIGDWYASAMCLGVRRDSHPAFLAASERGKQVNWLKAGDRVKIDNMEFQVLAPELPSKLKDDNNSLVMMLRSADGSILLSGDMEFPEEKKILKSGANVKCDVLKVANHGDNDTLSRKFGIAAAPQVAVICTSSKERPDTPSRRVIKLLKSLDVKTAVTEECTGGVLVRLEKGEASLERIDFPKPHSNVYIKRVSGKKKRIVLRNDGQMAEALEGRYLASGRGELFLFPKGTVIEAGSRLVVGTKSCVKTMDLLWEDKETIRRAGKETISLYDKYGMLISARTNREE